MQTEFERDREERRIIRQETAQTMKIGIACLISVAVYTLLAFFVKPGITLAPKTGENLYGLLILVIILIMVSILAVRKTIYYSAKIIRDDFNLRQVLQKWRQIDIILLASAETIPVIGLVLTWIGLDFQRTWFIFLVSAILIIILMPMGIKIKGKLMILREQNPSINA